MGGGNIMLEDGHTKEDNVILVQDRVSVAAEPNNVQDVVDVVKPDRAIPEASDSDSEGVRDDFMAHHYESIRVDGYVPTINGVVPVQESVDASDSEEVRRLRVNSQP